MQMQSLETRRLCSVTVEETYPGFYEILGDNSPNTITITVSQDDQSFTLDGQTYTGVAYLYIRGGGRDDTISVSATGTGYIAAGIDGGAGDDHIALNFDGGIWAGPGDDTLDLSNAFRGDVYGENGNDTINVSGECLDPAIDGGDGDDRIDASANNYGVVIRGGAGDDTIYGSEYDDQIYGDAGADHLHGQGGDDTFFTADGFDDHIDGGAGTDFLYADAIEGAVDVEYVFYG